MSCIGGFYEEVHYFSFAFYVVYADGNTTLTFGVWQQGDARRAL